MKKQRPYSWSEYLDIEASRIADGLNFRGDWAEHELAHSQPGKRGGGEFLATVREIKHGYLAATLMTRVQDDLVKCAEEVGLPEPLEQPVIRDGLARIWPLCQKLASVVSQPHTDHIYYEKVQRLCANATAKGRPFAPVPTLGRRSEMLGGGGKEVFTFLAHSLWIAGFNALKEVRRPASAGQLLLAFCKHYTEMQAELADRRRSGALYYRSYSYYKLAQHYLEMGERAFAARYAMMTFILDVLTDHYKNGPKGICIDSSGITRFLWIHFRIGPDRLHRIRLKISNYEQLARAEDWFDLLIYPDFVLSLLMAASPVASQPKSRRKQTPEDVFPPEMLCQSGNRVHHPLDQELLQRLWKRTLPARQNSRSGVWLERLLLHLFSSIDGLRVRHSLSTANGTQQLDLLLECLPHATHWLSQRLGPRTLVECKNWTGRCPTSVIFEVLGKMQFNRCKTGIVVCTGDFARGKAKIDRHTIRLANQLAPQHTLLLLGMNDLEKMVEAPADRPDFLTRLLTSCETQWDRHDTEGSGRNRPGDTGNVLGGAGMDSLQTQHGSPTGDETGTVHCNEQPIPQ